MKARKRNYKKEYKKFQSSKKMKKYRAKLTMGTDLTPLTKERR